MPSFSMTDLIAAKRDGSALSAAQIAYFVDGFTSGDIPDYQASALLMAIYLKGMTPRETADLTGAMAQSGQMLDLSGLPKGRPTLDKHSTGGVGDKTSLVVVPILAAAGVLVCKMSGRGLGHTGGTLDKLEAIPGFRIDLTPQEMREQVARVGACLAGQTGDLAPADKKIYALRNATATVGSLPLIVSSILSKKLAGGAQAFLFDVKMGSGALMETEAEARNLAQALVDGAEANGRQAVAVLSDMSEPLGETVGNALEVGEAIATLTPGTHLSAATKRFQELCVFLANEGLRLVGSHADAEQLLTSGAAKQNFREIVKAQGGDVSFVDAPQKLPRAPVVLPVPAPQTGIVAAWKTAELGQTVVALGGGRVRKTDTINPAVGLVMAARVGQTLQKGEPLASVHAQTEDAARAAIVRVWEACVWAETGEKPMEPALIRGIIKNL